MWFRLAALVLLPLPTLALAEGKEPAVQAPSGVETPKEAAAALLAASCSGCHGRVVIDDGFPQIYGLPAPQLREAMLAFRSGEREGTVMNRIAKGYSVEEIELLADYLAAQEPTN